MKDERIKKYLHKKIGLASGCTEPAAIAYAAAVASRELGEPVEKVRLVLSANIIKNALSVCLPCMDEKFGIDLAAAFGALFGDPNKELNLISGVSEQQTEQAERFRKNITISPYTGEKVLYISATVLASSGAIATAIIEDEHANITRIEKNGISVFCGQVRQKENEDIPDFSISEILEYVGNFSDSDNELITKIISTNSVLAEAGLDGNYGMRVAKTLKEEIEIIAGGSLLDNVNYIILYATAAVDARMAGADFPVMTNSGSGNQGLVATIPVLAAARVLCADEEKTKKAVLLSHLVTIYIKSGQNILSAYCGAVNAAAGVSAALSYLMGGDAEKISYAVQNTLGGAFGMFCDGAKESCALKVANCIFSAVYSAQLSHMGVYPKRREGLILSFAEDTIACLAQITKDTSAAIDEKLLEALLKK